MKLSLTITMDNMAFCVDPISELETIMAKVVRGIDTLPCGPSGLTAAIMDTNGNRVGTWTVTP